MRISFDYAIHRQGEDIIYIKNGTSPDLELSASTASWDSLTKYCEDNRPERYNIIGYKARYMKPSGYKFDYINIYQSNHHLLKKINDRELPEYNLIVLVEEISLKAILTSMLDKADVLLL